MIYKDHPNVRLAIETLTSILYERRKPIEQSELIQRTKDKLQALKQEGKITDLQDSDITIACYRLLNEEFDTLRPYIKRNNQTQTFRLRTHIKLQLNK